MIGWRLELDLVFPNGVSPGEGKEGTVLTMARDGLGRPVLRGTSLAGRVRAALDLPMPQASDYFGQANGEGWSGSGAPSRIVFEDCPVSDSAVLERTFHARDRHTGSVMDKSLFGIETTTPGVSARCLIWLMPSADESEAEDREILNQIARMFHQGVTLGGRSNRGFGLARLGARGASIRKYDLRSSIDDHADWLDDRRLVRTGGTPSSGDRLAFEDDNDGDVLVVSVPLRIPRGQDVLIADGKGMEAESEPQEAHTSGGDEFWRFPGSSFRGAFRSWTNRLAVREFGSDKVADTRSRRARHMEENGEAPNGRDIGWCFAQPGSALEEPGSACVVSALFGSFHARGRIHFSDIHVPKARLETQDRRHVAIDGIAGGAIDGLLFSSRVLVDESKGDEVVGALELRIENPAEHETRWIARCIKAMHMGLIRIGSSKSAGRLELAAAASAHGKWAGLLLAELGDVAGKEG